MKSLFRILILNLFVATNLLAQDDEFGIASYYSDLFQGKPTASGELYDNTKLTAAHKTLPFGTLVTVTRLENNRSVQVRINDRGPFISGRVIEVSGEAARRLNLLEDGTARVRVSIAKPTADPEPVVRAEERPTSFEAEQPPLRREAPAAAPPPQTTEKTVADTKPTATPKVNQKPEVAADRSMAAPGSAQSVMVRGLQAYQPTDLYEVTLKRPKKEGFGVQVAALTTQDALFRKIAELQGDWFDNVLVSVERGPKNELLYKIILGVFTTEKEAQVYKRNLKKNKKIDGFVVNLADFNQDK